MMLAVSIILWAFLVITLGFFNASGAIIVLIGASYFVLLTIYFKFSVAIIVCDIIFIIIAVILTVKPLRRVLLTNIVFRLVKKSQPPLSITEAQALNAGTVSFEGDFFSGNPCFDKLLKLRPVSLSREEQDFLDGPTEELCQMLNDYKIFLEGHLSDQVWEFIKSKGFLSMIIPKKYGGLEFSAWAQASVIIKLGSRNLPAAISVGVPNSLGPGELLLRYGTDEQKNYYLPRLAEGRLIPCFALTSPHAGSDAASIRDFGVVTYGEFNGQKTLGILLNWEKRYITLAPIATLIGLAFRLHDPEHLVSKKEDIGITIALIPRDLPGITIGKRHNPLDVKFQNGPITGKDVFIPLDFIIGGQKMMGQGWPMLMECLIVGRAITLPSAGSASAMMAALASGCYARIRHQFGLPIGRFLGVKKALARIGAQAYLNTSALRLVVASIDDGEEPAVASAIVKYHTTENCRQAVNDAMDIHGGKGICLGPKNYLSSQYRAAPINITVEGANILTRNMIIFGQGIMRCHPYLKRELDAIRDNNLKVFDEILFQHAGFIYNNWSRTLVLGTFGSRLKKVPKSLLGRRFQQLSRYACSFAFLADIIAITLSGQLKRQENISARLGDILSYLYLSSAALKRFHDDGQPTSDLPIVNYICDSLFYNIEQKIHDLCENLPFRLFGKVLYFTIFPWGRFQKAPSDQLGQKVADIMMAPNESFDRMTKGLFISKAKDNFLYDLKETLRMVVLAEDLEKRIRAADKEKTIKGFTEEDLVTDALRVGIINNMEYDQLVAMVRARAEIIGVDAF